METPDLTPLRDEGKEVSLRFASRSGKSRGDVRDERRELRLGNDFKLAPKRKWKGQRGGAAEEGATMERPLTSSTKCRYQQLLISSVAS